MTATSTPGTAGRSPVRLPYLPGLDGLRAIAVVAVLLYHAELSWITGGFLGVEVFFVISGYLITALLLGEWRATGRIDLKRFWWRRALRLLPALFLLLATVTVVAVVFLPDEVASLRGDVASALAYVTNWSFILGEKSYFENLGRPSLVAHLWSLAVEEQFYLVWPLVFAAGMRFLDRRRLPVALLGLALASTTLMWVLYDPDGDPSRVYYGTDTRASGIFLGALMAFWWSPWRLKRSIGAGARWLLDGVGTLALAWMVWMLLTTYEFSPGLYRGGFLQLDLVTLVVIAVAVHPAARLGRVLGCPPLRWLGLRSYGIYLWHWPIYVLTRPGVDVPLDGVPLLAVRLGLTLGVSELSYRYVERPIRAGALTRWWRAMRASWSANVGDARLRWLAGAVGSVVVAGLVVGMVVRAQPPPPPAFLSVASSPAGATGPAGPEAGAVPGWLRTSPTETTTTPTTTPPPAITAVGDSVMLEAGGALHALGSAAGAVEVDAAISRQVSEGVDLVRHLAETGELGATVVVHLGNNGVFNDGQFDAFMEAAGDRRVVFVTLRVPDRWQDPNNDVIRAGAERHPNAAVADWNAASHTADGLLEDDGMHLRPAGVELYLSVVAAQLSATFAP